MRGGAAGARHRRSPEFREKTDRLGERLRGALDEIAGGTTFVGEVRGLGPMLALELDTRERAFNTTQAARERGLILLSCGYDGNVVRILVPHVIEDADLERGPDDPRRGARRPRRRKRSALCSPSVAKPPHSCRALRNPEGREVFVPR